jgi:ribosomal protein S18 acetylase RimI-like enzyme
MEEDNYNFNKLDKKDIPIILEISKEIILNYYIAFLDKDIVNEFINTKQYEKEIIDNIENCIIMKFDNKIIGFSIILDDKIHLIMIDIKYQNKNHGTKLLKYSENRLLEKYSTIQLQSFTENSIANNFYLKNNWKKVEEIKIDGIKLSKFIKEKNGIRRNVV